MKIRQELIYYSQKAKASSQLTSHVLDITHNIWNTVAMPVSAASENSAWSQVVAKLTEILYAPRQI